MNKTNTTTQQLIQPKRLRVKHIKAEPQISFIKSRELKGKSQLDVSVNEAWT